MLEDEHYLFFYLSIFLFHFGGKPLRKRAEWDVSIRICTQMLWLILHSPNTHTHTRTHTNTHTHLSQSTSVLIQLLVILHNPMSTLTLIPPPH